LSDSIAQRNNVSIIGQGSQTLMLAHGFGCDQTMWRFLLPLLLPDYRIVLFDYVGSGKSSLSAFNRQRYATLEGYAEDVLDICRALDLPPVTFVGHSVSGMIGLLAASAAPELFERHILICPSPCFLNHPPVYSGGFELEDLQELIDLMDKNYIGWANYLAPLVVGGSGDSALIGELSGSFCSTDPLVAKTFARATFFSDYRHILPATSQPSLILQSRHDSLAGVTVGEYMHRAMPGSRLEIMEAEGHCLHMTHPHAVSRAIQAFMNLGAV